MTTSRRRAFTLLELMVASTMALIVVAAALSSVLLIIRTLNRTGQSSAIVTEVKLLSEYLVAQVQGLAGGAVRPWMATIVRNNSGADGSDVFTFADVPATSPTSATIMSNLGGGAFSLFVPEPFRGRGRGRCLLADLRKDLDHDGLPEPTANQAAAFSPQELVDREVILVSPSGETWRSVVLGSVGLEESAGGCFVRFAGSDTGLIANGMLTGADQFARSPDGREDLEQWVGGQVAFIRAREWRYVPPGDGLPGRLVERLRERGPIEERTLFEGVLDLQVALGYDFDPFDGVLREAPDGRDDEWINTGTSDNDRVDVVPGGLAAIGVSPELIRMIDIGVVIALPRAERRTTVQAFDGPRREGPEARVVGGRSYLRNLLLFL